MSGSRWAACMMWVLTGASVPALAQEDVSRYPSKPITSISYAPGGTNLDFFQRHVLALVGKTLGQPVVLVNRPGSAVSQIAISQAKPDGYTVGEASFYELVYFPRINDPVQYDPKEFTFIARTAEFNTFLGVRDDSPWRTFKDLLAEAKKRSVTYGSVGYSSPYHITLTQVNAREKARFFHVPFKATTDIIVALKGGHIEIAYGIGGALKALATQKGGGVRILAGHSSKRNADLPDVPTFAELGYPPLTKLYTGAIAPRGLPEPLRAKLERAYLGAMQDASMPAMLKKVDYDNLALDGIRWKQEHAAEYDALAKTLRDLKPLLSAN